MCPECRGIGFHDSQCPNFVPKRTGHMCDYCREDIYEGDEYMENDKGVTRHFECFLGLKNLLDFLGYEVQIGE